MSRKIDKVIDKMLAEKTLSERGVWTLDNYLGGGGREFSSLDELLHTEQREAEAEGHPTQSLVTILKDLVDDDAIDYRSEGA